MLCHQRQQFLLGMFLTIRTGFQKRQENALEIGDSHAYSLIPDSFATVSMSLSPRLKVRPN
jgi:hypothetical protein